MRIADPGKPHILTGESSLSLALAPGFSLIVFLVRTLLVLLPIPYASSTQFEKRLSSAFHFKQRNSFYMTTPSEGGV
ncbi:hypothetical protein SAMN04488109_3580 [Chryseolinea serpens]|uniref:Uncharacterized protein n=1 Tax=Chryseolinea serpens TaxID=947013 RepID=A0A1M5RTW5_9BACT|nr:hypothetical protein [Chryseolinea serpens]SHH29755.1 hypothetical protein SAMN04488109_3580 [Chryseolinea serpens]